MNIELDQLIVVTVFVGHTHNIHVQPVGHINMPDTIKIIVMFG